MEKLLCVNIFHTFQHFQESFPCKLPFCVIKCQYDQLVPRFGGYDTLELQFFLQSGSAYHKYTKVFITLQMQKID